MRVRYIGFKVGKWDVEFCDEGYVTVGDDDGNTWFFFSDGKMRKTR